MNVAKRLTGFVAVAAALASYGTWADTWTNENGSAWAYVLTNECAMVVSVVSGETELFVPAALGGSPATLFGPGAFADCAALKGVIFPNQDGAITFWNGAFTSGTRVTMEAGYGYAFGGWVDAEGNSVNPVSFTNDFVSARAAFTPVVVVKDVSFRQRYPWSGLVDIDASVDYPDPMTNITLFVSAKDEATGKTLAVRNVWLENDATHTNALSVTVGNHRLIWDAGRDNAGFCGTNVVVTVRGTVDGVSGAAFSGGDVSDLRVYNAGSDYFLGNAFFEMGLTRYGSLGSSANAPTSGSMVFHPREYSQLSFISLLDERTTDFFWPGTPIEGWYLSVDGSTVASAGLDIGTSGISTSAFKDNSSAGLVDVSVVSGTGGGLEIEHKVTFSADNKGYLMCVRVTNNSGSEKTNVKYIREIDPDQAQCSRYTSSYHTDNYFCKDALGNAYLYAFANNTGVSETDSGKLRSVMVAAGENPYILVGLASPEYTVDVFQEGTTPSYNQHSYQDWTRMRLQFTAERLASGQTVEFCYICSLDKEINIDGSVPFGGYGASFISGSGTSEAGTVDARTGVRIAGGRERLTYSPRWGNAASCTVTVATSATLPGGGDGRDALVASATEEGEYEWLPSGVGAHTFIHTAGDLVYTAQFTVLGDDVVTHAGTLSTNETWRADKVHLVTSDVTVPSGVSLLIEPGAVVKFMPGTSLVVENGATCTAIGVVFTHANDDTLQGDTLFDGETAPVQDDYKIVVDGNLIDDENTTEYRYMAPQELTSNVTSNLRLRGHRVYVVSNDVTVASGATLTIQPGAILKFASGKSLTVNSGGTLNAQGTRALPIVFTSLKDDAVGGDTNGDGDASTPAPDDWRSVKVSGTANFDNMKMLYGGGANDSSNSGMLIGNSGGKITLANCTLAHGMYDAIFTYAQITAENCALYDCDRGVNAVGGSITMKNCVVDNCRWGVMAEGGAGYFYNCSITRFYGSPSWPTGYGVSLWSGGSLTVRNCNVWTDSASGQNWLRFSGTSCISSDPRFYDAEKGDFRIAADSPCVDAGLASVAPAADYFGQKRVTVVGRGDPTAPDDGDFIETALPDIGIHEVMPRDVKSDVDLAVVSVVAPESFTAGEKIAVTWNVKNVGSETASGAWSDKVELVCANGAAVELGTVATSATLPADGVQTFSGTFTVPSAQVGVVRVRVTANANRDIFEGTLTANNVAESEAATLTMPELAFPDSGVASFNLAAGGSVGYRLGDGFAEGGLLIVHVASATAGGVKVWTGNGQVPTADIFYAAAVEVGGGDYLVRVPAGGDAYVSFANEGSGLAKVDVGVEKGAFLLFDTGVVTAPNAGTVTLTLFGNGFEDGMEVYLVGRGDPTAPQVRASEIVVFDPVKAVATFDVTGLAPGAYEVHVKKGGAEDAASLLALTETRVGPKWSCKLDIASNIRSSREYVGYLEYANTGDMPLDTPYVKITAGSGSFIRLGAADAWGDTLELMAVSETYPASQLKPGETRRIPFRYKTTSSSLSIECGYTQEDATAFPWDTNAAYMRPSWASDELWGLALAVLKSNVGMTWNAYLARMRANCDHLAKIGQPTHRLDRIWQLEINEALGVDHAVSTLASNTDLARSGRGFGLALSRSYGSGLYRRLRKGIFGYGWSDNYGAYAELQNSGATLALHSGSGSTYLFEKVNGTWTPEDARDKTTCTESSTEYVLTYRSGTVQRIAKSNMRVSSVTDNQGNSLTFTYNADKQLVKVEHCDGQSLSFTYGRDALVASATDDQGRTTRYEYSGDLLVKVTAFNGLSTQYRYLPADGSVTSRALRQIAYADGTTRDYTYDGAGRVATVSINGNLQTVEIERGALGSYAVIAPNGGATTVTLGASGEVLETVNALGQKSTRTYTADTLLEAVVGPTGKRAKIAYDEDGQAVKATDAAGADTHFGYTSDFGNLAKVTDARGNSFDYGYDKKGRSKSISYADGSIESIAYNDRGDVTNSVNRRGQSIAFTYDREGNTLSKVWDDGRTFTWAYDAKGNCTNATDSATGAVTMECDENERLVRIVHPKGRGFAYEYDELGRTVSRTMLGGSRLSGPDATSASLPSAADVQKYEYDTLGRLSRMTDGDGNLYVENHYDDTTGWLVTQTYGNGTVVSNAYDILGRTIGIYHLRRVGDAAPYQTLAFFEYAYDAEGRRISQTTAEGVERYTYDTVGQLTDVIYPDGSEEHFTYDAVGNRITSGGTRFVASEAGGAQLAATATYTANNLNQYTSILRDSASPREEILTYDLDGNMTRKGDTHYYYDIQNRLVAVTNTTKDIAWSCEYDVFGNRTSVTDHDDTKEYLFVQGSLASVAAEYGRDALVASVRHILLGSVRLADVVSDSVATSATLPIRYYHADGLASTRLLTDANGDTIATASYRAFGQVRTGRDALVASDISAGWVGTLGVERDDATGLVFMRNRYYDAEQGRFIQMDPISIAGGDVNPYCYCCNDSNNSSDPTGLIKWEFKAILIGVKTGLNDIVKPVTKIFKMKRVSIFQKGANTIKTEAELAKRTGHIDTYICTGGGTLTYVYAHDEIEDVIDKGISKLETAIDWVDEKWNKLRARLGYEDLNDETDHGAWGTHTIRYTTPWCDQWYIPMYNWGRLPMDILF